VTRLAISALVTLLVTVGPLDVASLFLGLAGEQNRDRRRRVARRASLIGVVILIAFALGGNALLKLLDVGLPAFRAAGGILLLLLAVDLLLARHSGLSSITPSEEREAERQHDVAVFPLAIPLIAGPGSMTAVVLLMGRTENSLQMGLILAIIVVVGAITFLAMIAADRLVGLLGQTGVNVIARVSGVILAALAVQFIFDGIGQSGLLH